MMMNNIGIEFLINMAMLELYVKDYVTKNKNRFDLTENGIQSIKHGICDGIDYYELGISCRD